MMHLVGNWNRNRERYVMVLMKRFKSTQAASSAAVGTSRSESPQQHGNAKITGSERSHEREMARSFAEMPGPISLPFFGGAHGMLRHLSQGGLCAEAYYEELYKTYGDVVRCGGSRPHAIVFTEDILNVFANIQLAFSKAHGQSSILQGCMGKP